MSPKNKGTFGKGKSAVEPEDEFLTTMSRVGRALEPHVKTIIFGVVGVTVVLLAIFGWRYYVDSKEEKATHLYAQALTLADVPVYEPPSDTGDAADGGDAAQEGAEGQSAAAAEGQGGVIKVFEPEDENDDNIPDSFPTRAERAQVVMGPLDELYSEYGSTDVAETARLLRAGMRYDLGRYQEAYDDYEAFAKHTSNDTLEALAREGMGHASEALAQASQDQNQRNAALQQALESYRAIQTEASGPEWERAVYHTARVQVALGQADQAKESLRQALEGDPEGPMAEDIRHYLAQLEAAK